MRTVLRVWLQGSAPQHSSSVGPKERDSPLHSKTPMLQMGRGTLKRETRVGFCSEVGGTGLLNESGEKGSVVVQVFVICTWVMFSSAGQINSVRELCFCEVEALDILFLMFICFQNLSRFFFFLGLIFFFSAFCFSPFSLGRSYWDCRFSVLLLAQGSQGCQIRAAVQGTASRKGESQWQERNWWAFGVEVRLPALLYDDLQGSHVGFQWLCSKLMWAVGCAG